MKYIYQFIALMISIFVSSYASAYTFSLTNFADFGYVSTAKVYYINSNESNKYYTVQDACNSIAVEGELTNGYTSDSDGTYKCKFKKNLGDDEEPYWFEQSRGLVQKYRPNFSGMAYSGRTDRYHASEICYGDYVYRVDGSSLLTSETGANGTLSLFQLQTYPTNSFCNLKNTQVNQQTTSSTPPTETPPTTGGGSTNPPTGGNGGNTGGNTGGNNGGGYEGGGGESGGGGAGACYDEDYNEIPCTPTDEPTDPTDPNTDTDADGSNSILSYLDTIWDWLKGAFTGIGDAIAGALKAVADMIANVFEPIFDKLFTWLTDFKSWISDLLGTDDAGSLEESEVDVSNKSESELANDVLGTQSYDDYIQQSEGKFRFNTSASCPPDVALMPTINANMVLSYQPLCDFAVKINPIIVAFAYLGAIFILVRV